MMEHLGQFPFWFVDYCLGIAYPTGKVKHFQGAIPNRAGEWSETDAVFGQVFPQLFSSSAVEEMLVVWEW